MNIGGAINQLRVGKRIVRKAWEIGRPSVEGGPYFAHWIMLVDAEGYDILSARVINESLKDGNPLGKKPWLALKTADGEIVPYTATHSDLLAEDWVTIK